MKMSTYVHVPLFWCIYEDSMARSSSALRSLRFKFTGIGCLSPMHELERCKASIKAYFLALNHFEPRRRGKSGMTRSSARNMPFSLRRSRRASYALNFPFNFSSPTTRDMNLMLCRSRRSLYSRCGSLVIKHTPDVRGSTRVCFRGLNKGDELSQHPKKTAHGHPDRF